jgi:hypothetical protein
MLGLPTPATAEAAAATYRDHEDDEEHSSSLQRSLLRRAACTLGASMSTYTPCAQCHCLVRATDRACPFCGATISSASAAARVEIGSTAPRISRAAWLAVASSVAAFGTLGAGCLGATTKGDAPSLDASSDAAEDAQPAVDPACLTPDAGDFACGATICNAATEYCERTLANSCSYDYQSTEHEAVTCSRKNTGEPWPAACRQCPTCACINAHLPPSEMIGSDSRVWMCETKDGGGVQITTSKYTLCGGCYGSPPARLERLAASREERA